MSSSTRGGLFPSWEYLNKNKTAINPKSIYFKGEKGGVETEIAMQYNDGYDEKVFSFANNINTPEGGTHLIGFKAALTRTMNTYANANNLLKNVKMAISGEDLREGLTAVISVKIPQPQFEGQTKTKLGNSEVKGYVENPDERKTGHLPGGESPDGQADLGEVDRCGPGPRSGAQRHAISPGAKGRWRSVLCRASWPTARKRTRHSCELFLVEVIRPGGSAKQGRDRKYQAILPLKGKISRGEGRFDKMISSQEIRTLIAALGTSIGKDDFDIAKLRYNRIIVMTDADVDGSHILTLLLTFFLRQMHELVERGYLYIASRRFTK